MNTLSLSLPLYSRFPAILPQASPAKPTKPVTSPKDAVTLTPASSAQTTQVEQQSRGTRPAWLDRLSFFATDAVDAGRIFSAAGAAGWLGQVAQLSSVVWGPVFAGIGLAAGGVQMAASAFTKDPAVRRDRIISGSLEMLASAAAMTSTLGLSPVYGAAATVGLIGVKLVYDMLSRPTAPAPPPVPAPPHAQP